MNASSTFARRLVVRIASAVERLHPLEQVGDLDVRVAVARVLDLGALAEQRVGLVEQQDAVHAVGLGEDPVEVLLGLADVLVDDGREVDDVEVEAEVAGDDLRRHRLARPGVAGEQAGDAAGPRAALAPIPHSPTTLSRCRARAVSSRSWRLDDRRQDEVRPADDRLDPAREALEAGGVLGPRAGRDVVDGHRPARRRSTARRAACAARTIWSGREAEGERDRRRVEAGTGGPLVERGRARARGARPTVATGASRRSGASRAHAGSQARLPDEDRPGRGTPRTRGPPPAPRSTSDLDRADDHARAAQAPPRATPPRPRSRGSSPRPEPRQVQLDRGPARGGRARPAPASGPTRPAARGCTRAGRRRRSRGRASPRRRCRCATESTSSGSAIARPAVSSPRRWAVTRSGTRSERVRNGRSASSTSKQPAVDERSRAARARTRSTARAPAPLPGPHELQREARRSPGAAKRRRGDSRTAARTAGRGPGRARRAAARRRTASSPKARASRRRRSVGAGRLGRIGGRLEGRERRRRRRAGGLRDPRTRPVRRGGRRPGRPRCTGRGTGRSGPGRRRGAGRRRRGPAPRRSRAGRTGEASDGSAGSNRRRVAGAVPRPRPAPSATSRAVAFIRSAGRAPEACTAGLVLGAAAGTFSSGSGVGELDRPPPAALRRRPERSPRRRRPRQARSSGPSRTGGPNGARPGDDRSGQSRRRRATASARRRGPTRRRRASGPAMGAGRRRCRPAGPARRARRRAPRA